MRRFRCDSNHLRHDSCGEARDEARDERPGDEYGDEYAERAGERGGLRAPSGGTHVSHGRLATSLMLTANSCL